MSNPFTIPNYIIYESPVWENKCSSETKITSRILKYDDTTTLTEEEKSKYTQIGPNDFFYIERYLSVELSNFIDNTYLVKRCSEYATSLISNTNLKLPSNCSSTFANFSSDNISNFENAFIDINSLNNFSFTDEYIKSKTNPNDKKELCQRVSDLNKMLEDISIILSNIESNKQDFPDQYVSIKQKYTDNKKMRDSLQQKIQEIYTKEISSYNNSKLYLDSTIYTSVLWTILATTLLFYIFKKL
jgi:hypothetical protein